MPRYSFSGASYDPVEVVRERLRLEIFDPERAEDFAMAFRGSLDGDRFDLVRIQQRGSSFTRIRGGLRPGAEGSVVEATVTVRPLVSVILVLLLVLFIASVVTSVRSLKQTGTWGRHPEPFMFGGGLLSFATVSCMSAFRDRRDIYRLLELHRADRAP